MVIRGVVAEHSRPALGAALLAGLLFSIAVHLYAHTLGYPTLEFDSIGHLISFTVLLLAGAASAYALFEYRLVVPTVILGLAFYRWLETESSSGPGIPFVGLIVTLPIYLVLMIVAGRIERRIRVTVVEWLAALG